MFLPISTHFTATPGIPLPSPTLQSASIERKPRLSPSLSHPTQQTTYELFTPNKSGQRSHPTYHRGCWHVVSCGFLGWYCTDPACSARLSSHPTGVYDPKAFVLHAASLRLAFAHCAISLDANSRRSLDHVSVPVWPVALSGRLPIVALVGHYPTNKLMGRRPIHERVKPFPLQTAIGRAYPVLPPISGGYPGLKGRLPTCYAPVRRFQASRSRLSSLDSHSLSTPLACVLSQDQTLQ